MNNQEMYSDMILDSYKSPRNFGSIINPDIKFKDSNPSCGDVLQIEIKIRSENIIDIKFNGSGCAISLAAAELLLENVKGKNLEYVKNLSKDYIISLLGVELSPLRLKCALLSLKVLKFGVYNYLGSKLEEDYANS